MFTAVPAIPVKPDTPAMIAIIRKVAAHPIMVNLLGNVNKMTLRGLPFSTLGIDQKHLLFIPIIIMLSLIKYMGKAGYSHAETVVCCVFRQIGVAYF